MRNTRSQQSQPSPTDATISSASASRSGRVRKTVPPATQSKNRPTRSQAVTITNTESSTSTNQTQTQINLATTQHKRNLRQTNKRSRYEEDLESDGDLSDQFNPNNDLSESDEEDFENHNRPQVPATKRPRTQLADSSNYTATNTTTQNSTNSLLNDDWTLPTISNYKSLANAWPTTRIDEARRRSGRTGSAVPPNIQTEAEAIKTLYNHHKEMLALMGNVTLFTLNKAM